MAWRISGLGRRDNAKLRSKQSRRGGLIEIVHHF
jgi:hypothetical protein